MIQQHNLSDMQVADFSGIIKKQQEKRMQEAKEHAANSEDEFYSTGHVSENYVKHAFSLLDKCIDDTKKQSANFQKWRRQTIKDLEFKSQYLTTEEMEEEEEKVFLFQKTHTYEILDGKFNDDIDIGNEPIKKESIKQENTNNANITSVVTKFIIDDDEED